MHRRLLAYLSQHLLRKIPIRQRLIGAFVLLALLPLVISGIISYAASTAAIGERTRVLSTEVVKQVAKNIEIEMAKLESDSEALVLSERIQDGLAHYAGGDDAARALARRDLLRVLLERYGSFNFIAQKYLLDRDDRIIDAQVFPSLGQAVEARVARAPKRLGRPAWSTYEAGGQTSMVLLRAVQNKANNALLGSLFLGVRPAHFSAIFKDVDLGSGTDMFLFDAEAGAVMVRGQAAGTPVAGPPAAGAALRAQLRRSLQGGQRSGFTGYDDIHLAAYSQVGTSGWFVVSTVPLAKLSSEAQSVRDKNVLIGLAGLLVSIALAMLLARSISAPLERLVQGMRATETGNYGNRMAAEGNDELTQLARRFNEMTSQVALHHVQLEARVRERTRALALANARLAALSMTDGLTGIANRRRFDEALAAELARATRTGAPLALLMLDVDFFKAYNDCYGHQQGDACLRQIAALLAAHARRASDLAARYGGEEFALIAADTDGPTALALAEAIRAAIEALQLPHAHAPLAHVSMSIGVVALLPDDATSVAQLLGIADQALYRAKQQGRNQVVVAPVGRHA